MVFGQLRALSWQADQHRAETPSGGEVAVGGAKVLTLRLLAQSFAMRASLPPILGLSRRPLSLSPLLGTLLTAAMASACTLSAMTLQSRP